MNRRSFLKALFALPLAALVPPERDTMQIGDILKKMGRASLTTAEQEALRLWGNETQSRNANVGNIVTGASSTDFDRITANEGVFGVAPIGGSYFCNNNAQEIQNHVESFMVFDGTSIYDQNSIVVPYLTGNTKFHVNPIFTARGESIFFVSFYLDYDAQYAGLSYAGLTCYKKSDDSIYPNAGYNRMSNLTEADKFATFPMNIQQIITASESIENVYFRLRFHQESGSTITVNYFALSFSRIR